MKREMMKWVNHWYWIWPDWKKKFNSISFKRSHRGRWSVGFPSPRRRSVLLNQRGEVYSIISTIALGITNLFYPAGGGYAFFSGLTTALTYMATGAAMWGATSLLSSLGQKKSESSFAKGSLLFSTMTVKDVTYCRDSLT